MSAASPGAQVHQHAGENWEGEHPQEPVDGAAASNADDGLPLAALEQGDDDDKCPQAEQQEEARPRNLAFLVDHGRQLAGHLLQVLLVVVQDGARLAGILLRASVH